MTNPRQAKDDLSVGLPFAASMSGHTHLNSLPQMTGSPAAVNRASSESNSQDYGSESFSSNVAQQDEMEAYEDAINEALELELELNLNLGFDAPETITEDLNATVLLNGLHLYEAENMNQPCDCPCHHWNFDEEQIDLQVIDEEVSMLERWIAQDASDASKISLQPDRDDFLPCQVCSCHDMLERSLGLDVDISDQEEE